MKRVSILLSLSALAFAGCATVPREAGFADVERSVADRSGGKKIRWHRGGEADREVAAELDRLLDEELTAGGAVQIALLNNRRLQATYEDLAIAQADLVAAGLLSNPIFDAQARFADGGTNLDLGIAQNFIELLYLPLHKHMAGAAFEAAKLRVTGEVLALAGQVRRAFISHQAALQTLEMRAQAATALEASSDLARRLREAGNIIELDFANERAAYEQARVDLHAAEVSVAQQRETLNDLLGLWGRRTTWTAAERLPEIPSGESSADSLERRAIERNLLLAAARFDMEQAAGRAGIEASFGAFPDGEFGATAEREEGEWSAGPSLELPLPLFNQGQPARAAALAEYRRAREQHAALAVEIRARVRAAYIAVIAARERAMHYKT
ncbi:MAG: TolC family protein, partial [Opitutaceae bacterium]